MSRSTVNTASAPAAIGAYSQAIKVNDTVYVSGQIPLDPSGMQIVSDDFLAQASQVFKNLNAIGEAAGGSLNSAVKLTVYLTDLNNFAQLNEVMAQFCEEPYPARAAVEVAALPKGALIEIDAVMFLG